MNVPPAEKKQPGRLARGISRVTRWPRELSLAARAAWVLGLFLLLAVLVVWIAYRMDPNNVPWGQYMTAGRLLALGCLGLVIPLVFYQGLRLWLEGERSPFPEIDYAWSAGLKALRQHGLSLDAIPVYLILGTSGEPQERTLVEAGGYGYRVRGVPEGPAPLHWYANPDRIDLFISDVGQLGRVAALVAKRKAAGQVGPAPGGDSGDSSDATPDHRPPYDTETPPTAPAASGAPTGRVPGGQVLGRLSETSPPAVVAAAPAAPGEAQRPRGTMVFQAALPAGSASAAAAAATRPAAEEQPRLVAARELAERTAGMEYLCRLLRNARSPLCPTNGVLVALDFETVRADGPEAAELERAVRGDLRVMQRALRLRAPVTALVVGLEEDRGFRELVRRVGRERAATQRFGQRFDLRCPAEEDELAAFCVHVCGVFEDWIYQLFNAPGALARPGNVHLYGLLCKVRTQLQRPLGHILAHGFGHSPQSDPAGQPVLFSGCYFAATGPTDDRRAFVRGVFDKLDAEQEDVEWTPAALAEDRRYFRLWLAGALAAVALAAGLLGLVALAVLR